MSVTLMFRYVLYISLCLFGLSCTNVSVHPIVINGLAQSVILLPEEPSNYVEHTAEVLQSYVNNISGAEIPIIDSIFLPLDARSYILISEDTTLDKHLIAYGWENDTFRISAGEGGDILHAVYFFLENELGVRYYTPDVEYIPKQQTIELNRNLQVTYKPPITTRTVHSRLFYEYPEFAQKLRVTAEAFPGYVPSARVHTFHRFMPADQFYNAHPEYYALRNGKRLTTQLCLTNESVFQIVMDSVIAHLERYPQADVISISQDDNTQYCQCSNCEAIHQHEESPAGSMIHFVNKFAEAFPDKQISTLAYQYTRKAPKYIKPLPNVLITLCSIECDRSAAIDQKCKDFTNDLKEWSAISDNIRIWDYTTQFTNFLAPFPNIHTLRPNIHLFRDNNAKWIFEQHSNQPSELFELRSYLTAQLLWNPEVSQDVVINDFLSGYYGDGGPYIRSYIDKIHDKIQEDSTFFLFLYGDPSQGFESFLNLDLLSEYDNHFDKAIEAVSDDEKLENRIDAARLSIDYAILEFARRNMSKYFEQLDIDSRLNRFIGTCSRQNITAMNEMGYSVNEYVEGYKQMMSRAAHDNLAHHKKVALLTQPKKYAGENPQVLVDGALGGANFYANWLGFEGNDMGAIIDLEEETSITEISSAFLQVTNHIVFFPTQVQYLSSLDGKNYALLEKLENQKPLSKESKINDIQFFKSTFPKIKARYIKIIANNSKVAPDWHHAAGLPSWIFVDEIMVK